MHIKFLDLTKKVFSYTANVAKNNIFPKMYLYIDPNNS